MALILLAALLCVSLTCAAHDNKSVQCRQWMREYARDVSEGVEYVELCAVWAANMEYIQAHNDNAHLHGYRLAMNQFGDLV